MMGRSEIRPTAAEIRAATFELIQLQGAATGDDIVMRTGLTPDKTTRDKVSRVLKRDYLAAKGNPGVATVVFSRTDKKYTIPQRADLDTMSERELILKEIRAAEYALARAQYGFMTSKTAQYIARGVADGAVTLADIVGQKRLLK